MASLEGQDPKAFENLRKPLLYFLIFLVVIGLLTQELTKEKPVEEATIDGIIYDIKAKESFDVVYYSFNIKGKNYIDSQLVHLDSFPVSKERLPQKVKVYCQFKNKGEFIVKSKIDYSFSAESP